MALLGFDLCYKKLLSVIATNKPEAPSSVLDLCSTLTCDTIDEPSLLVTSPVSSKCPWRLLGIDLCYKKLLNVIATNKLKAPLSVLHVSLALTCATTDSYVSLILIMKDTLQHS